ncbi:MAG: glycosyltransferase [Desulfobacterales bacterium]|nr:glycosyltransferase [Desulfobacterales bacterium]
MNISVVVPAKNEERFLPDLLDSLMPQLGYGDEVIVVDNHSTDETANMAELYGAKCCMRMTCGEA